MPANERAPSFLFWVGDFLSDPVVAAMSAEEVGAYVLLLCYAWQSDRPGVLANDDAVLARLTRLHERWPEHREAVLRAFVVSDKVLTQKRMVAEARATARRMERARASGERGANARWGAEQGRVPNATAMPARGMPVAVTEHRTSTPASPAIAGDAPASSRSESNPSLAVGPSGPSESPPAPTDGARANQQAVLDMLGGVAGSLAAPPRPAKRTVSSSTQAAWDWLKLNATPDEQRAMMALVGWFVKTGTTDSHTLLALTKHAVVYKPANPHAYFTEKGETRQSIAMKVAADRAVSEHELAKQLERDFLKGAKG